VVRCRRRVAQERSRKWLALAVVQGSLEKRLAETLGDAAVNLPLDDHRIDGLPAVVDGDVSQDVDIARPRIDLYHASMSPEGRVEVRRREDRRALEHWRHTLREIEGPEGDVGKLGEREARVGRSICEGPARLVAHGRGVHAQSVRSQANRLLSQLLAGKEYGAPTDRKRAAPHRAASVGDRVGIPMQHRNVLRADPQLVGGDLREGRLEPLTVGGHTRQERDPAHGIRSDGRVLPVSPEQVFLVRRPWQAAADASAIHVGRDPDADVATFRPQFLLPLADDVEVELLDCSIEAQRVVPTIEHVERGCRVGKLLGLHEVPPA
jgi:hypothetical protein